MPGTEPPAHEPHAARPFRVIENAWIPLAGGLRLAARIWMPEGADADPVPAILEYLPYRKRDGTAPRDEATYPAFAAAGYAGIRVDIRGSGESDGVIDGEYTARELSDAEEVIAWIRGQSWSDGTVGMMGISWGGFNALQVAARKPAGLKAVISIASSVDRYNDDIHYKGGCQLSANLSWAATMLAYQSRAPDPAIVGDAWRGMWLDRLRGEPFMLEEWLSHQRRDAFWAHGSICQDFPNYDIPTFVIAGWADGYRNTPFKLLDGAAGPVKALVGPWIHKYPHFAWPRPRADFTAEAIAWWDRWLKGRRNAVDDWPDLRAYILDGPKPVSPRLDDPGEWVASARTSRSRPMRYHIDAGGALTRSPGDPATGRATLSSPEDLGTTSGEWFTLKPDAEMAGDQAEDDARALCFDTDPVDAPVTILGRPVLRLSLVSDVPAANLVARLVDLQPDGTATRICYGVLNLTHREGDATPRPLPVGEEVDVEMTLDACGYRLGVGHRLRLALSTAYWPTILPHPRTPRLEIARATLRLDLPSRTDLAPVRVPEPADPDPLPRYPESSPPVTERIVERDAASGLTLYRVHEDTGRSVHPGTGLGARQVRRDTFSIDPDDPVRSVGEACWTTQNDRGAWKVRTECTCILRCTAEDWILDAHLTAFEGEQTVLVRHWSRRIPRDGC